MKVHGNSGKKEASNAVKKKRSTNMNNGLDIKNINSEQMLFFTLQEIKSSINKLDDKIDSNSKELNDKIDKLDESVNSRIDKLDDKIDRNFLWTLGVMITSLSIMIGGFIGLVAIILSKH